jgi:hypothetical protein
MASIDWSRLKGCWAKICCSFIIWNIIVHLFQLNTARKPRFYHCSSNQVNFRTSLFLKSCCALDRSCHAKFTECYGLDFS